MGSIYHTGTRNGRIIILSLALLSGFTTGLFLHGQDVPSKPLSIPVYHPMLINPAFVGSKDFTNISFTTKALKYPDSQVLSIHKRLANAEGDYTPLGLGAYAFHEQLDQSWNTGLAVSGSYHVAVDDEHLHNISVGVTAKGILLVPKKGDESISDTSTSILRPNMDLGIYYYGPHAFGGISVTTLFDTKKGDTLSSYSHIDREYHLYGGYKFVLSKAHGIVLEPSLLVSLNDSTLSEPHKHLVPYLKLYVQNVYIGTYLKDFDIFALFFQYQFPKLYAGVFLEFPRIGYLNDDNIIFEVSVGVNLGTGGAPHLQYGHW
jgi:type IX secretion system PorP/SprF family membrane protein